MSDQILDHLIETILEKSPMACIGLEKRLKKISRAYRIEEELKDAWWLELPEYDLIMPGETMREVLEKSVEWIRNNPIALEEKEEGYD